VILIITGKKILYIGTTSWTDASEQQFMLDKLSMANNLVWVNPFGDIRESLLPKISRFKSGLVLYYPGMNFIPLPFLQGFNEKRRLFQVILYLIETEFEPDLVWFDDPVSAGSANYYRKKNSQSVFFACPVKSVTLNKMVIERLKEVTDLFITTDQKLYKKFENTGKAHLLNGDQFLSEEEKKTLKAIESLDELNMTDQSDSTEYLLENAFTKMIEMNLEQLSKIIK
jgi:hypothetical protein